MSELALKLILDLYAQNLDLQAQIEQRDARIADLESTLMEAGG